MVFQSDALLNAARLNMRSARQDVTVLRSYSVLSVKSSGSSAYSSNESEEVGFHQQEPSLLALRRLLFGFCGHVSWKCRSGLLGLPRHGLADKSLLKAASKARYGGGVRE